MSESNCQNCNSNRVIDIYSHASDLHSVSIPHMDYEQDDGYMPYIDNLGGGDDLGFSVCLECGQIQGKWPVGDPELEHEGNEEDDEDEDDEENHETDEEYKTRVVQRIKKMPDKDTKIFLSRQLYSIEKINDVASYSLLSCLKDGPFHWLSEHNDCWRFEENDSEWGTLVFKNPYSAHCFAEQFDLTYMIVS